ncbi:hypothetical protein [Pseudostreptobacillus hongkongensis]|uniref:hypothetical protein n=1 Tax=Pseudostreptobacillus hongkongensis TaxID=1162717 RepID=UPI00083130CE|nr:hypothetical protein [Pseudostreptobacillus hongkongensis]
MGKFSENIIRLSKNKTRREIIDYLYQEGLKGWVNIRNDFGDKYTKYVSSEFNRILYEAKYKVVSNIENGKQINNLVDEIIRKSKQEQEPVWYKYWWTEL